MGTLGYRIEKGAASACKAWVAPFSVFADPTSLGGMLSILPITLSLALNLSPAAAAVPAPAAPSVSAPQEKGDSKKDTAKDEAFEWTLEKLFDKDATLLGPSARSIAFSHDGLYAAYLWRPFDERRHGSDLWIYDVKAGKAERITSVSVLEPFQKSTRKVGLDRIKKAGKKDKKKDDGKAKSWKDLKGSIEGTAPDVDEDAQQRKLMDMVTEKDAKDDDAPRYRGISDFIWSPDKHEMLVATGGDIYRYQMGKDAGLQRLTKTRQSEREVQYLPDGSGYTSLIGDALVRVEFGDHFVDQLDPSLPGGMTMREYALSPDGKRVVFVASSGSRGSSSRRTVDIATYRGRFMKVRTVPRTVSDDPISKSRSAVFLYELPKRDMENGRLIKVYERESSGPRDVLQLPDWAPDSSRVTFSVFDQKTSQVHVLEAAFDEPKKEEKDEDEETADGKESSKDKPKKKSKPAAEAGDELEEEDAKIVHRFLHNGGPNTPRMIEPKYLADSRRIALLTEQTGFRHVHVLDPVYETLEPITRGHFEVYPIEMSKDRTRLFVEATKEDSACLDVYELALESGEMKRLTNARGRHTNAAISKDGKTVLAIHSAFGSPRELVRVDVKAKKTVPLTDTHPKRTHEILKDKPEFFNYANREGQDIKGYLFEPKDRKKGEKRPLLIYVYGGPLGTSKQVVEGSTQSSAFQFANYMTKTHGWVTATIDPRGMSGYGALFEKANFEQVGKPQVNDLVDGVKYLIEKHGVDPDRVAIHGWSFGGFQTQMCMYTEPKVFTCGIAGAGPTEWENYNSWYSTGTIGDSREGKTDLDKYSLLRLAKGLKGKLLLVHGMEDSNVLYQDTVRVYAELLDAGKETLVELFVDPTGGHGLGGHVKSLNRFRKYEEFLLRANK